MTTFKELGLNPMILQALEEIGFETPTPIQSKTIPHLINSGNDLIGLAQTGTGKTAAFSLPIIQQLNSNDAFIQSLILCPTRELAIQISKDIENYTKYSQGVTVVPVFGGERIDKQIRAIRNMPQIVVGTPGRVMDLIKRKVLKVDSIKWLVLDEADEMLNMGFKEELDEILSSTPENKQVLLFSATMNQAVRRIANNYMKKPDDITVGEKNKGTDNVQHFYYVVHERDRYQALKRIADINPDIHGIVFCRTRRETQMVADKLIQDHYSAEAIHGEISQEQRIHVMNRFRDKKIQLLVATDVAARGIDVEGLTHVINYNLPQGAEAYLHRSGRTGRAHNLGISISIVNMREQHRVRSMENRIGKRFEKGRIPSGDEICEKQLFSLVDKVNDIVVNEDQISKYIELINKKFEHMSRDELVKKIISVEFNRFLEHYKDAADLNSHGDRERKKRDKSSVQFARFKINIGRNDGLNARELLQFINQQPDLKNIEIGNIEMHKNQALFEAEQSFKGKVIDCFQNAEMNDIEVRINCVGTDIQTSRYESGGDSGRPKRDGGGHRKHRGQRQSSGGRKPSGGRNHNRHQGNRKRA